MVTLLFSTPVFSEKMVIDSDQQLGFVHSLMEKGNYEHAVYELERFIYFFPESPDIPKAHYLTGVCHFERRDYDKARVVFFDFIDAYPDSASKGKVLFLIGESYYLQGVYSEASYYFHQVLEKNATEAVSDSAAYRLGWVRLQHNEWDEASRYFANVTERSPLYADAQELEQRSVEGASLPYKSPQKAGVMAGLLPGLGHAYVGRYKDATVALLLNGLFTWAAVEAFREDHYVLGGMLGFLELGWYSGNIYSAVNVTHKHNRRLQEEFRSGFPEQVSMGFFSRAEGEVGFGLNYGF
jgi:tetratricopeptide (TPR) repeat protein